MEALRCPKPASPFRAFGDDQMHALRQLSTIFNSTIPDDDDTALVGPSAFPAQSPPTPRIPSRVPLHSTPPTQAPLTTPPRVQTAHLLPPRMPKASTATPQRCALPPLLPNPIHFPSPTPTTPYPPGCCHHPTIIEPDDDNPIMYRYPFSSQQQANAGYQVHPIWEQSEGNDIIDEVTGTS